MFTARHSRAQQQSDAEGRIFLLLDEKLTDIARKT
jgi:hypothetical protein